MPADEQERLAAAQLAAFTKADPETKKLIKKTLARQHRMAMAPYYLQAAGLTTAFVIALVCLISGVYLIANGHSYAGSLLSVADVTALASVFAGARWVGKDQT